TQRSDDDGVTEWIYDQRDEEGAAPDVGLLVATISPFGVRTDYTYEGAERRLPESVSYTVDDEDPVTLGFDFDDFARLSRVIYPEVDGESLAVRSNYDLHS